MSYKVSDGYYWHARLPSGQWGVFWCHPANLNLHRQVALFEAEGRAKTYAEVETDLLDEKTMPDADQEPISAAFPAPETRLSRIKAAPEPETNGYAAPLPRKSPVEGSMTADAFERARRQVVNDLEALFNKHPDGVPTRVMMTEYGLPYDKACRLMNWLHDNKLGTYVYGFMVNAASTKALGGGRAKVLVRTTTAVNETDLTDGQERVVKAMASRADRHQLCTMSVDEIAAIADVQPGSVHYMLTSLERKNYLMLSKPGGQNGPAIYQLLDKAVAVGA